MRRHFLAALLLPLAGLLGCGGDGPADPDSPTGDAAPEQVVHEYFEHAKQQSEKDMLALGTEKWLTHEAANKRGFTLHIVNGGYRVKSYALEPTERKLDGVRIRAKVVFLLPTGKEDREVMDFHLRHVDGRWRIAGLR